MYYKRFLLAPLLSSGVFDVTLAQPRNGNNRNGNNNNNSNNNRNNNALQLNSNAVQTASKSNGLDGTQDSGTSASATDDANFINFCSGKTLTNGQQIKEGSCNGIVMGEIPSTSNMISTIITKPKPGDFIPANTDFTIDLKVQNLVAGSFTNPQNTYYAAPQALQNGKIVGHTHVTVQNIGSFDTKTPPDPTQFVFFKGINDAGDGNGGLTATVSGGLPAGIYRVCTMTSASNHQPVLMPVAQRGAQDDCQKFTVFGGNNNSNNNNNNNNNNQNNQNTNTTKKNGFGNGFGGFGGGFGQRGKGRFAKREFIA